MSPPENKPEIILRLDPATGRLLDLTLEEENLTWIARDCLILFLDLREQAMRRVALTESQLSFLLSIAKEYEVDPTEPDVLIRYAYRDQIGPRATVRELTKAQKADLFHKLHMLDSHETAMLALTLNSILEVQERHEGGLAEATRLLGLTIIPDNRTLN